MQFWLPKMILVRDLLSLRLRVSQLMVLFGPWKKKGAHSFYAKDVWTLIQNHCLILRQSLSLLPEDSPIFVGAGFPCPDLTIIGRGNGLLGLAGDRSVLIHCGWAVLYFLSCSPLVE